MSILHIKEEIGLTDYGQFVKNYDKHQSVVRSLYFLGVKIGKWSQKRLPKDMYSHDNKVVLKELFILGVKVYSRISDVSIVSLDMTLFPLSLRELHQEILSRSG